MQTYQTSDELTNAIDFLVTREPRFKPVFEKSGTPSLRKSDAGLEGLLTIVTEQFLSLGAAAAIWQRVRLSITPFSAEVILKSSPETLKQLGLSAAKAKTFHATAHAVQSGALDFANLQSATDEDVTKSLCALPGIGPWTADIYLLSALTRTDAWPKGDLALQVAAQYLFNLETRPSPQQMLDLAEAWRPHRAAAARLLWSHYRALKNLKPA